MAHLHSHQTAFVPIGLALRISSHTIRSAQGKLLRRIEVLVGKLTGQHKRKRVTVILATPARCERQVDQRDPTATEDVPAITRQTEGCELNLLVYGKNFCYYIVELLILNGKSTGKIIFLTADERVNREKAADRSLSLCFLGGKFFTQTVTGAGICCSHA